MDAGNIGRVAPLLRAEFPEATLVILADNDVKPGKAENPGVAAATAAARATGALLALSPQPGDMNDLAASFGLAAVAACVAAARPARSAQPTYKPATLAPAAARLLLDTYIAQFMADVASYWAQPTDAPPTAEGMEPDVGVAANDQAASHRACS